MDAQSTKAWRKTERERLIEARMAAAPTMRRMWGEAITRRLQEALAAHQGILGVYWPFRAEFDPRPVIDWAIATGRGIALPVVVDKKGPLEYRSWKPGEPLVDGVWNIPVPEKRDVVMPTAVLAPVVGFDPRCYRLGYGGGYFDRTLAALSPRPVAIGVGFELQAIDTIHPQDFDIPMAMIVTEAATHRP